MKLFILGSLPSSLVNFRGALILALRKAGHQVEVAAPGMAQDRSSVQWLKSHGVICHDIKLSRTGVNPFSDLCTLLLLWRLLRAQRPDLFLCYTIKPVIWGLFAARLARVPKRVALITGLGYSLSGQRHGKGAVIQQVARWLLAKALRYAHLVFFQNPDDRDDFLRAALLRPQAESQVLRGSGIDLATFAPMPFPRGALRFLMIARLLADKGLREYAAAAQQLSRRHPMVEFHLIGGADSHPNSVPLAEIQSWQQAGDLHWHGAVQDVRPALAGAHVFVLPSYREGTPRSVLEAMAMGRPVITTDVPGCRETIVDGESGFLIPRQNSAALVQAMQKFIDNPQLIQAFGTNARQRAVKIFDVHQVNHTMLCALGLAAESAGADPATVAFWQISPRGAADMLRKSLD